MVGALSIVRFRSAIKNPMDLVYLFWSISVGIVCGAGLYEIAVISSVVVTVLILGLDLLPVNKPPYLLVLNTGNPDEEKKIIKTVRQYAQGCRVKSRNISNGQLNLIIELRTNKESELLGACTALGILDSISLLSHDGEVRG